MFVDLSICKQFLALSLNCRDILQIFPLDLASPGSKKEITDRYSLKSTKRSVVSTGKCLVGFWILSVYIGHQKIIYQNI